MYYLFFYYDVFKSDSFIVIMLLDIIFTSIFSEMY